MPDHLVSRRLPVRLVDILQVVDIATMQERGRPIRRAISTVRSRSRTKCRRLGRPVSPSTRVWSRSSRTTAITPGKVPRTLAAAAPGRGSPPAGGRRQRPGRLPRRGTAGPVGGVLSPTTRTGTPIPPSLARNRRRTSSSAAASRIPQQDRSEERRREAFLEQGVPRAGVLDGVAGHGELLPDAAKDGQTGRAMRTDRDTPTPSFPRVRSSNVIPCRGGRRRSRGRAGARPPPRGRRREQFEILLGETRHLVVVEVDHPTTSAPHFTGTAISAMTAVLAST